MVEALPTEVDVVVVGAGAAGAAFAGRLAETGDRSILVLDAGPDPRVDDVPATVQDAASLAAAYDPRVSDGVSVDLGDGRRSEVRRGRLIGGSSAVNGAYFVRGRPDDFERWAERAPSWSPAAVLESFVRLEHDLDLGDRPGHGAHGPMPVSRDTTPSPVTDAFFAACAALGHVWSDDLNSPGDPLGLGDGAGVFGTVPRNVRRAVPSSPGEAVERRVSAAEAYLDERDARADLVVRGGHRVRRVVIERGRAVGVELAPDSHGVVHTVHAEQVVLSAGAIGSAELLVRSGVGPADLVRAHGLQVVHDAQGVGDATFDHPCIDLMYRPHDGVVDPRALGLLQGALHLDGIEVLATRLPYGVVTGQQPADSLLSLRVTIMRPTSRGRLRWSADGDPSVTEVDAAPLVTDADRALARRGVRSASALAAEPGLAAGIAEWFGPSRDVVDSDVALDRWIHAHLGTAFHLAGTAPMGPVGDAHAVVGPDLRVHGVEGLRVVDASIMPEPLSRGPAATTVMIGEHAAVAPGT